MKGKRVEDVDNPRAWHSRMNPCEYRVVHNHPKGGDVWECCTPNGHAGNLASHDVTEHDDGTITVSPSILVSSPQEGELWHGWLERGVWREA